jgi:mannose-6-phosphate isomerase-like protein (cupin superfamily)
MAAREAFALDRTYVQLHDGPRADPVPVGPDFWDRIDQRTELHAGRLVIANRMTATWSHWEMHPAGDEVLFLISGAATVLLEEEEGERAVALTPGTACVVPQGVWHTALVDTPGMLLSITRGEGTEHRPCHTAEQD